MTPKQQELDAKIREAAFDAGFEAGAQGKAPNQNPFDLKSACWCLWHNGWSAGFNRQQRGVG